ncbi:hypothetical protein BE221DRAFT_171392, partial [Ostreococcus tauri]
ASPCTAPRNVPRVYDSVDTPRDTTRVRSVTIPASPPPRRHPHPPPSQHLPSQSLPHTIQRVLGVTQPRLQRLASPSRRLERARERLPRLPRPRLHRPHRHPRDRLEHARQRHGHHRRHRPRSSDVRGVDDAVDRSIVIARSRDHGLNQSSHRIVDVARVLVAGHGAARGVMHSRGRRAGVVVDDIDATGD